MGDNHSVQWTCGIVSNLPKKCADCKATSSMIFLAHARLHCCWFHALLQRDRTRERAQRKIEWKLWNFNSKIQQRLAKRTTRSTRGLRLFLSAKKMERLRARRPQCQLRSQRGKGSVQLYPYVYLVANSCGRWSMTRSRHSCCGARSAASAALALYISYLCLF